MPSPLLAPVNLSGSIASGGTSQVIAQANANRTRFTIVNIDTTNDLWWSPFGIAAPNVAGSVRIPANGGILSFVGDAPGTVYSVYGAVTSQQYTAWADA